MSGDADTTDYTNIVTNVLLPFDPRRTKLLMGSLEYIAAEVVVAKVVRKIIKADTKGWLRSRALTTVYGWYCCVLRAKRGLRRNPITRERS